MNNKKDNELINETYPLTIVKDRYSGAYSEGKYTAWNLDFCEVPQEIDDDDTTAAEFFYTKNKIPYGKGETPDQSVNDLSKHMKVELEKRLEERKNISREISKKFKELWS